MVLLLVVLPNHIPLNDNRVMREAKAPDFFPKFSSLPGVLFSLGLPDELDYKFLTNHRQSNRTAWART